MPRLKVQSFAQTTASPDQAWAVVRDFCEARHPAIETMTAERTAQGGLTRAFTVNGEDKIYRERLTYFSDSDRTMAYAHVEGIDDVQQYDARLTVYAASTGATISMNESQTPADFAPSVVNVIAGPEASEDTRAALTTSMQGIPTQTYADALRCFTNPLEKFDFAKLTMPVLLMTGAHDRLSASWGIGRLRSGSKTVWPDRT